MKERPALEAEDAFLRPVDVRAGQVGRQQVGRELQALEVGLERMSERLHGTRLGEPRRPFDEQVAVGEQRDQQPLDQPRLPDDLAAQVFPQAA